MNGYKVCPTWKLNLFKIHLLFFCWLANVYSVHTTAYRTQFNFIIKRQGYPKAKKVYIIRDNSELNVLRRAALEPPASSRGITFDWMLYWFSRMFPAFYVFRLTKNPTDIQRNKRKHGSRQNKWESRKSSPLQARSDCLAFVFEIKYGNL